MIWTFFIVVGLGLVAVLAALVTSRLPYDPMSEAVSSANDPGLPEAPHARDVDGVRFDFAVRGYRMDQVDDVLDALRNRLAEQEADLAVLRSRMADTHTTDVDVDAADGR
ncbi:MAG: DivIVA domain-containing protein [Nostocoides sp.]